MIDDPQALGPRDAEATNRLDSWAGSAKQLAVDHPDMSAGTRIDPGLAADAVLPLSATPAWTAPIPLQPDLAGLDVQLSYEGIPATETERALAYVEYLDAGGAPIPLDYPGLTRSSPGGMHYVYLRPGGHDASAALQVAPPVDAAAVRLGLRSWGDTGAGKVMIRNELGLLRTAPAAATDPEPPRVEPTPVQAPASSKPQASPRVVIADLPKPLADGSFLVDASVAAEGEVMLTKARRWLRPLRIGSGLKTLIARVRYQPEGDDLRKKAVGLIQCFDRTGQLMPAPYGNLPRTSDGIHYFYLPHTGDKPRRVFTVEIPPGTAALRLGFAAFNSGADEGAWIANRIVVKDPSAPSTSALRRLISHPLPSPPPAAGQEVRALTLLDEPSQVCWEEALTTHALSRTSYRDQIRSSSCDFMLLESCWTDGGGAWDQAMTAPEGHPNRTALLDALDAARSRGLPTVLWSNEDPVFFERFLALASRVDHVFAADESLVDAYRQRSPGTRVHVLPFGAPVTTCNPTSNLIERVGSVLTVGPRHGLSHEGLRRQLDTLQALVPRYNGVIQRRAQRTREHWVRYPDELAPFIRDSAGFQEAAPQYREFKALLDVSASPDARTAPSRSVYEALASGTPVVCVGGGDIRTPFPGIVQVAETTQEAAFHIDRLMEDHDHRERLSHLGYRAVMREHSYSDRLDTLLKSIGMAPRSQRKLVSVILCSRRPGMIDRIIENVTRQTYPDVELILTLQGYSESERARLMDGLAAATKPLARVELIVDDGQTTLGARLNRAIDTADGDYIAKMDDDDLYFPEYLWDMLLPFRFGDYALVGKRDMHVYVESQDLLVRMKDGVQHRSMRKSVAGATFVMPRAIARTIRFSDLNRGEDTTLFNHIIDAGGRVYSADAFNFVVWRGASGEHTWTVDDDYFAQSGTVVGRGADIARRMI